MPCVSSKQFIEAMLTHLFNFIYSHFPFSLFRHFGKKYQTKRGFSVRVKKPAFLFHFFVYEICMNMSYHIRQLVSCGTAVFLLESLIFRDNGKNCYSLIFTVLQIHIKIKSLLEYKSVWPSGWVFKSHSCSNLIALSQVRVPTVSN